LVPVFLHVSLGLHPSELGLLNVDAAELNALAVSLEPEVLGKGCQVNISNGILKGSSVRVVEKVSDVLDSYLQEVTIHGIGDNLDGSRDSVWLAHDSLRKTQDI
jgi:hypothetical protein